MVREGFRLVLQAEIDIKVVGEAENGRQAVELARNLKPAVIVMDLSMPLLNGLEATRRIHHALPTIKILILSAYDDDAYVDQISEVGAAGFVLKQSASDALILAIREVYKGKSFFSVSLANRIRRRTHISSGLDGRLRNQRNRLSSREVEVLQLIAEGSSNKRVAEMLGISAKTVDKHRQHLMTKLDHHETASLTRYAISTGVIESNVQLTID